MKITVLGAGAFGTVLADFLCRKNYQVTLWGHSQDSLHAIAQTGENSIYLPGFSLCKNLQLNSSLSKAVAQAEIIVSAVPSQKTREVFSNIQLSDRSLPIIVCASKGIENNSLLLLSDVFIETLGEGIRKKLFFLSGPSFAQEVIEQKPTAVTIAGVNEIKITEIQNIFSAPYLRSYTHSDIIGVQIGGAMKNVIAIAIGAVQGCQLGHNAQAGLITRGLTEMSRLGIKMGASLHTFMGLSGLGDLVLTSTGTLSRNLKVGRELAQGKTMNEILQSRRSVAEGIATTLSVYQLAQKHQVDLPICSTVYRVLYEQASIANEIDALMSRSLKNEFLL